jgi:hypothetical protein
MLQHSECSDLANVTLDVCGAIELVKLLDSDLSKTHLGVCMSIEGLGYVAIGSSSNTLLYDVSRTYIEEI